jgi:hypothetical protein
MAEDQPRQLAVLRTYEDGLAVLRARRDELDISNEVVDEVAGLARGHTSHLIAHRPSRGLRGISWNIWEALGLKVVVLEDPAALARAKRRSAWHNRRQHQPLPVHAYPSAK